MSDQQHGCQPFQTVRALGEDAEERQVAVMRKRKTWEVKEKMTNPFWRGIHPATNGEFTMSESHQVLGVIHGDVGMHWFCSPWLHLHDDASMNPVPHNPYHDRPSACSVTATSTPGVEVEVGTGVCDLTSFILASSEATSTGTLAGNAMRPPCPSCSSSPFPATTSASVWACIVPMDLCLLGSMPFASIDICTASLVVPLCAVTVVSTFSILLWGCMLSVLIGYS